MNPITLEVILLDGTSTGIKRYHVKGWDLVAYQIPRDKLDEASNRIETKYSGIYFLRGKNMASGENVIYVGQAMNRANGNGILGRIKEHKTAREDYWSEAIIFTPTTDLFKPGDLCYLESTFYKLITEANICRCENGNTPADGNPNEGDTNYLDNYVTFIKTFLEIMQVHVFVEETEDIFVCTQNGTNARARRTLDGFYLLKGSKISHTETNSCPNSIRKKRKLLSVNENDVLTKNFITSSASEAAGIVCGASVNGMIAWRNEKNKKLLCELL